MGTKLQDAASKAAASGAKAAGASGVDSKAGGQASPKGAAAATNDKGGAVAVASKANALTTAGIDLEADSGMGLEGADKDSFAIPFIAMLQGLSPQLKTVDDAKPGRMINTVTNEVFTEIRFVPVAFQRRYNRWVPRSQGGGFKGTLTPAEVETLISQGKAKEEVQVVDGKETTQLMYDGTQLKDTRNHFVLLLNETGGWSMALISLASTQIKRSKRLMSLIQNFEKVGAKGRFNPPSFASIFSAHSESEKNAKGEFESWVFEREGDVTDPELYAAAKAFHAQVAQGAVVVAPPIDDGSDGGDGEQVVGGKKGF